MRGERGERGEEGEEREEGEEGEQGGEWLSWYVKKPAKYLLGRGRTGVWGGTRLRACYWLKTRAGARLWR